MSIGRTSRGKLEDPFNGLADLHGKALRVLHEGSFLDDPTRLFRAARFAGRFGFSLDPGTEELMVKALESGAVKTLSADRVRIELEKLLKEADPAPAFRLLNDWGVLAQAHSAVQWDADALASRAGLSANPTERLALALRGNPRAKVETFLRDLHFTRAAKQRVLGILDAVAGA